MKKISVTEQIANVKLNPNKMGYETISLYDFVFECASLVDAVNGGNITVDHARNEAKRLAAYVGIVYDFLREGGEFHPAETELENNLIKTELI